MSRTDARASRGRIRTPDQRLRVFISSTLGELADERRAARRAVEQLHLAPVMFELGARPHPPRELYRSYLSQSDVFVGIYWQRYGWVAPDMEISGLEDEFRLSAGMPRLVYVKRPAPDIEPRLSEMLAQLQAEEAVSYKPFGSADELHGLMLDDLAILLAERFDARTASAPEVVTIAALPSPTSTFVGRGSALAELRVLLESSDARLVTMTGAGGTGKTRLALEAAAREVDRFTDGVLFVDLSTEHEEQDVLPAVLRALRLSEPAEEPAFEALRRHLRDRRMLLVLDNFEHVTAAAGDLVRLLEHCPALSALVTSREALRVRGEHVFVVPPLTLPAKLGARLSVDDALAAEAVRLFVERSRAAAPGFALTPENAATVVTICTRLDGLPLAIELAAARVKLLGVDELAARLETRLDVLRHGARDLPERQQTLRQTIAWSTELLTDAERAVMQLLSVFVSAPLTDVEQTARRVPRLAGVDVVDALHSLVDKSLASIEEEQHPQARPRLSMLNTVRAYAAEQLDEDRAFAAAVRRAHAEHYTELALELHGRLQEPGRADALSAMSAEAGNIRAAWDHWARQGDLGRLEVLLDPLWGHYEARGDYRSAMQLGDDLLAVLSRLPETPDRRDVGYGVEMDLARTRLAVLGFTPETDQAIGAAVRRAPPAADAPRRFASLNALASLHMLQSDFVSCGRVSDEMMTIAKQQQDPTLLFHAHLRTGMSRLWLENAGAALEQVETSLVHLRRSTATRVHGRVGPNQAVVAHAVSGLLNWMNGFPDRAAVQCARALHDAGELGHPYSTAFALHHAALLELWRHDHEAVEAHVGRLLTLAEEHDYAIWRGLGLVLRGTAKAVSGDVVAGLAESDEGVAICRGLSTPPVFWPGLLIIRSAALTAGGRHTEALEAIQAAEDAGAERDPFTGADTAIARGDVLVALPEPDTAQAETLYARGADLARRRLARMVELEALTRLAALRAGSSQEEESREALREVFEGFTEGFTTPQLVAARAVLGES